MKNIKICLVGIGRAGMIHALNYKNKIIKVDVDFVVDPDPAAEEKAEKLDARYYNSLDDVIKNEDFDAVSIGAPTFAHYEAVMKAAEAGKAIFCEKPLSLTLEEAEKMEKIVKEKDLIFQIGFMRRFTEDFIHAKKLIEQGKIGEVIMVKSVGRSPGSGTPSNWIADVNKSNGLLAEVNSHDFDAVRWLAGKEFKEVFAYGSNLKSDSIKDKYPEFYDTVTVNIKFEDEILGMVDGCYPATYGYDARTEVLGSEGMIKIGSPQARSVLTWNKQGKLVTEGNKGWQTLYQDAYLKEDMHFINCIRQNKKPKVGITDGKKAVEIVLAANRSIKKGEAIKL
ncbi:MAG: Gfo/Idh/MocA family oxidoreductase [bacterium]